MKDFPGRYEEVALLSRKLNEAMAGESRFVLVEGVAGIGKTALLQRFVAAFVADRAVADLLHASGDQSEVSFAYGVIEQLALSARASIPEDLSSLNTRMERPPEPQVVGSALLDLVRGCLASRPVVIVIDDLHWVDTPSQLALLFALRRLQAHPVLTLFAARDRAGASIVRGLRNLIASGSGTRICLCGLAPGDIREVAASMGSRRLSARSVAELREHTGGNPLHLKEVLAELPASMLSTSRATPLPAAASVTQEVVARLGECPAGSRQLVAAAAVVGMACPLALATRLGGVDEALGALDAAVEARLVGWNHAGGQLVVTFQNPMRRAAVYHALGVAEQVRLHLRAADLVPDEAAALRHRIAAACGQDEELAGAIASLAAREAAGAAWASAAGLYTQAGRLMPDRRSGERHLLDAMECLLASGDTDAAAELGHVGNGARSRYLHGRLAHLDGQLAMAEEHLNAAWGLCAHAPDPELATKVSTELAHLCLSHLRPEDAVKWGRRGLRAAAGNRSLARLPLVPLTFGLSVLGRAEEALTEVASLDGEPQGAGPGASSILLARAGANLAADHLAAAKADAAQAVRLASREGPLLYRAAGLFFLATTSYRLGAWDEAVHHAERGLTLAGDAGCTLMVPALHRAATAPLAARGAWEAAEAHVAEAAATATGPLDEMMVAMARALLSRARDDHAGVIDAVEPLRDMGPGRGAGEPGGYGQWQDLCVEALIALRRLDEAEEYLLAFEKLATRRNRASTLSAAARLRGSLEGVRGRSDEAHTAFRLALDHAANVPMPFELALVRAGYGAFLRRQGRRAAASEHLAAAAEGFARLGARPFLAQCERELAASGVGAAGGPTDRRRGDSALTAQESTVARLVLKGLTNREVADELVLSVNTVEYHLKNIYPKLGVSSRTQLMAKLTPTNEA
jgi:DNA-binding CsgD family transcriptional regulator